MQATVKAGENRISKMRKEMVKMKIRNIICLLAASVFMLGGCTSLDSIADREQSIMGELTKYKENVKDSDVYDAVFDSLDADDLVKGNITLEQNINSIRKLNFNEVVIDSFEGIDICSNLEKIYLDNCLVKSFDGLEALHGLKKINIGECKIDPECWKSLQEISNCTVLKVHDTDLTDKDVHAIAKDKYLEKLILRHDGVNNFNCFAGKKNFRVLELDCGKNVNISKWSDKNMNPDLRLILPQDSYIMDYSNIKEIVKKQKKKPLYGQQQEYYYDDAYVMYINGRKINFKHHTSRRYYSDREYADYVDAKQFIKEIGGTIGYSNRKKDGVILSFRDKTITMDNLSNEMSVNGISMKCQPYILSKGKVCYIPVDDVVKRFGGTVKRKTTGGKLKYGERDMYPDRQKVYVTL